MEVPNPFKLERLTITAVKNNESRTPISGQVFEAMFNPPEYSVSYRNIIRVQRPQNARAQPIESAGQEPNVFTINLVLDGTGASEIGLVGGFSLDNRSVMDRVKSFLSICRDTKEHKHEAYLLHIQWGVVGFYGSMKSVSVNYTLFDQSGNPLRAKLTAEFIAKDSDIVKLSSPDLTHTRTVKAGDSLPLLAKEIYGSSRYYLLVAEANSLDDFRNIKQGTVLHFPPLTNRLKV